MASGPEKHLAVLKSPGEKGKTNPGKTHPAMRSTHLVACTRKLSQSTDEVDTIQIRILKPVNKVVEK